MKINKKYDHVSIIIPAYNESKNLQILTSKILRKYPNINIVIVDDSDKEKNIKLKRTLKFNKQINIISRLKKMGRGSAVLEGFRFALKNKKIKIFVEMDADLAHEPDELPLFLKEIKSNDMVVGSRYLSKSKIIKWPIARLIQSRIINYFLKIWLGLNLTDYTNGYRAYSRRAVEFLVKQKLKEMGFISLSETAFRLREADFKISEVAITFRDRKFGESSANFKELMTSLLGAVRIRFSGEKKRLEIISQPFFYGLLSLLFIYLNYSKYSWNLFNNIGGLAVAKIFPELLGILFFLILSKSYISRFYPKLKIKINRQDILSILLFIIVGFLFHFKQFYTYFWKDDFYYFLNRVGTSYSFYEWGPWLSSYSLWVWELVRYLFGYSIFPYQVITIFSHVILGSGVYFFVKYLTKNQYIGFITAFFVITTPITFEAFQWLTQPMDFAWQAFIVCISLIALVWELEQGKGKKVPYLSAFLMMASFGAGIARIGFVLPLISSVTFLTMLRYFRLNELKSWIKNFFTSQWIFYLMVFVFFVVRGLLSVGGTKAEVVTTPLYKIYLYVIGVSSFPIEFFVNISKALHSSIPVGVLTVWFGFLFLTTMGIVFLVMKIFKRKIPIVLSTGIAWLMLSSLYYTLFAPHLPATDYQIKYSNNTHHLSYITSIGSLMVWGFFYYGLLNFLLKLRKQFKYLSAGSLIIATIILNYYLLSKQYDVFLDFPKGVEVPRQQFFFETYRKYIPENVSKVNVFYDDGALKRRDNYRPNEYYYWSFWDINKVKVFYGDKELKDTLESGDVDDIHYIYTDYDDGLIEEDLSSLLRDSIYNPKSKNILNDNWKTYWGSDNGSVFLPETGKDQKTKKNYFKNPVIYIDKLDFPSILTPKLELKLNVQRYDFYNNQIDLRAGILAHILNNWELPSVDQIEALVEYYSTNPSQGILAFNDLFKSVHVNDKLICGQKSDDYGIAFLVVWMGEPDTYYNSFKEKKLLSGYLDRYYSICYFSNLSGYKEISVDLPNIGSILRQIVIVPLTKDPVSIKIIDANLETPQILE